MEKKKQAVPFLLGLVIGVVIFFLVFMGLGKKLSFDEEDRTIDRVASNPSLHLDDWEKVSLESAAPFIETNKIEIVAFIDNQGGFFIADKSGVKLKDWCRRVGTDIPDDCSKLHAERITDFNQLTIFITEASPGCPFISAGGYSIGLCP